MEAGQNIFYEVSSQSNRLAIKEIVLFSLIIDLLVHDIQVVKVWPNIS